MQTVAEISNCKEPETKLLRRNLHTWPDEITKLQSHSSDDCSCSGRIPAPTVCATSDGRLSVVAAVDHFVADLLGSPLFSFLIFRLLFYWFFQERKGDLL